MNANELKTHTYGGKEYNAYTATQKQRKLETLMRKQRQDIKLLTLGNADKDTIKMARIKYRNTSAQYADFSDKMGLKQQRERVYIDNLGRV